MVDNYFIHKIREIANNTKYTKWYCSIIEKALNRPKYRKECVDIFGYVELHHILPKSFKIDDFDNKQNLVFLTPREHFLVHLCATKMFTSTFKNKMVFAFQQLRATNKHQTRYINSRFYKHLKTNKQAFIRLYKVEEVKYIYSDETQLISNLIGDGWSEIMTPEFKVGRVGHMKGRKHSEESKKRMSEVQKTVNKEYLIGIKRSDETKTKIKETRKQKELENPEYRLDITKKILATKVRNGTMPCMVGEKNPMFGKHHSDETKSKLSKKNKGRKLTDEHKEKLRITSTGRFYSEETRKKLSACNKGKIVSEETKAKLSELAKKRRPSEETKRKIGEASRRIHEEKRKLKELMINQQNKETTD